MATLLRARSAALCRVPDYADSGCQAGILTLLLKIGWRHNPFL